MTKIEKLLKEFKELNLPNDQYIIFGSGPLGVRKIRDVNDLDVFVTEKIYQELKEKYSESIDDRHNKRKITLGDIDISLGDGWEWEDELGFKEAIKRADIIDGFSFICLEDLITLKEKMGRDKDFNDIKLIKNYLK